MTAQIAKPSSPRLAMRTGVSSSETASPTRLPMVSQAVSPASRLTGPVRGACPATSTVDPDELAGELVLELLAVGVDHDARQLAPVGLRLPAKLPLGLRGVADEGIHLGRALVALVRAQVLLPVQA